MMVRKKAGFGVGGEETEAARPRLCPREIQSPIVQPSSATSAKQARLSQTPPTTPSCPARARCHWPKARGEKKSIGKYFPGGSMNQPRGLVCAESETRRTTLGRVGSKQRLREKRPCTPDGVQGEANWLRRRLCAASGVVESYSVENSSCLMGFDPSRCDG
ncbi:hypothetical protein BDV59DRAFT_171516 [Aspergillus ambiguus]|uniref:uncharacterized protein n=1 Tax=Aspergillus ambiguus TaxID=176160 RepID=UPI003CCE03E7